MTYANPLSAPEPKAFTRRNVVRCTKNEITDMPIALKAASKISAGDFVPFWNIEYECLDVKFDGPDAPPFVINFGSRLVNKHGEPLDKTQRPAACAQAFAGLDIIAFPDDPEYEEDEIVGHCFVLEGVEFATGKPAPLPIEHLEKNYVYEGDVRVITRKDTNGDAISNAVAVQPGGSTPATAKEADAKALGNLADSLASESATSKEDIVRVVRDGGFGAMTINGSSIFRLAINDELVPTLQNLGYAV